MKTISLKKSQLGLNLIELMVTLTIGLFLVIAMGNLYYSNKNSYRIQNGLANIQETGRFVSYIMAKDLRMAGYQGCGSNQNITANVVVKNPTADMVFTPDDIIIGYEAGSGSWSPALPSNISSRVASGTDVVTVRYGDPASIQLKNSMAQPTSAVTVYSRASVNAGDIIMITDCQNADIFAAGANSNAAAISHGSNNNISPNFSKAYSTNAQIMHFQSYTYFVGDSGRRNANNQIINSLFRVDLNGTITEIVEGVDNMQITYGVDTNGDNVADTFATASVVEAANNWSNVKTVSVQLLLTSVEELNSKPQSYTYNGATVTPTDRQMRRAWTINIALRNRNL